MGPHVGRSGKSWLMPPCCAIAPPDRSPSSATLRRDHLYLRNERRCGAHPLRVHRPGRFEAKQSVSPPPRAATTSGLASAQPRQLLPERATRGPAVAQPFERPLGLADCVLQWWMRPGPSRPCAISKPHPRPSTSASLNLHVMETNVHVAVRRVVVAVDLHRLKNLNALRRGGKLRIQYSNGAPTSVGVGQRGCDIVSSGGFLCGPGCTTISRRRAPIVAPSCASIAMLVVFGDPARS